MRSLKKFMSLESFEHRKEEKRELHENVKKEEFRMGLM
mgnify:CR=1 FL=1